MSNSETLFKNLSSNAVKNGIDSLNEKNNSAHFRLALALTGILLFVGAEGLRTVFRKNFGAGGVNLVRVIICGLCFIGVGVLSFSLISENSDVAGIAQNSDSYLVTGVLLASLGVFIIVRGVTNKNNAIQQGDYSEHQGDVSLLAFLQKKGYKSNFIKHFAEPFTALLLGGIYSLYNLIGGLPIMACAVSYWLFMLMLLLFSGSPIEQKAKDMNKKFSQREQFHEVR